VAAKDPYLSVPGIAAAGAAEIGQQPGCHNVQEIAIQLELQMSARPQLVVMRVVAGAAIVTPKLAPHSTSRAFAARFIDLC